MQKGNAALLLLLLGLIIVVVAVFYAGHSKLPAPSLKTPTIPTITSSPTYINQNLGFEFSYSDGLTVKEDSEEQFNERGGGDFRKNFTSYIGYAPGKFLGAAAVLDKENNFDKNPFSIWVFDNPEDLTIDSWHHRYWYYPFVWGDFTHTGKFILAPKDEATISGQMGKSGIIDYQEGKPKFVYLAKDKRMYLFRIISETGDKILSTLRLRSW